MHDLKGIVRKFYGAIWNNADKAIFSELLSENFSFRGSLGLVRYGHAGFVTYMDFISRALGEYRCEIVDMVAEGNKVYARMLYSGIHQGDLFGYSATHARLEWDGVATLTLVDGKIIEIWVLDDIHNVMKQLARYVGD